MSKRVSVFNNVLGPVMRGPSSSHTAASYHIGRMARDILGSAPANATIYFDEGGSYPKVYREQGSDRAFVSGLMDWDILDEAFHDALRRAKDAGCDVSFESKKFAEADHPNWVKLVLSASDGERAEIIARSVGGGSVEVTEINGHAVDLRGDSWAALDSIGLPQRTVRPIFFPVTGEPLFRSAEELARFAEAEKISVGEAALQYECRMLGMSRDEAMTEMGRRYDVMKSACERALRGDLASPMQLLEPTAHKIFGAGEAGRLPFWGPHARAAARAMAVMHANSGMDVVVAAPTGGAAGALPGAIITLEEDLSLSRHEVCMALFTAGAIGLILDTRATFAAEVAGCQVEIGAGGAMASAACAEASGGTVRQTLDAAAISFQNTMGSVCDPVQGMVEIPCHTRNASAASAAFVNASLVLGGYENSIPLDETIDAVYEVGKMLPSELRCTALGGLSVCPSALAMGRIE